MGDLALPYVTRQKCIFCLVKRRVEFNNRLKTHIIVIIIRKDWEFNLHNMAL